MGNPIAAKLTPNDFLLYRAQRTADGINPKTVNNMQGYLCAVFNELKRNKLIDYENPLSDIRKIRIKDRELSYLQHDDIKELFEVLQNTCINPHVVLITKICLSTGCRWGEAQNLKSHQIRNKRISFTKTKSGKNRAVPITAELEKEIKAHGKGQLFTNSEETFRRTLRYCSFNVPAGQATHILRHTFASHFMINGGNILTLQRILGHSSINLTMRYAHLAPEHLEEATRLNPLSNGQNVVNLKLAAS
ncbi:MAG: tyrosine-type recombinase/integrase [Oleiphilaceae bacterium]|nr:tyrosine-type recombinase/integrase [Oleiphilaceae bacterium]